MQKVISQSAYNSDEILQYVAAVQQQSEHYIARGIVRKLKEKNLDLWQASDFKYNQGIGVTGVVNGKQIIAAGPNYFNNQKQALPVIPEEIDQTTETITYVLIDNQFAGFITLADTIRETSAEAIAQLKIIGIKSYLLTGDNDKIASAVAKKLQMDGYFTNVLPHQKQDKLKRVPGKR